MMNYVAGFLAVIALLEPFVLAYHVVSAINTHMQKIYIQHGKD